MNGTISIKRAFSIKEAILISGAISLKFSYSHMNKLGFFSINETISINDAIYPKRGYFNTEATLINWTGSIKGLFQ